MSTNGPLWAYMAVSNLPLAHVSLYGLICPPFVPLWASLDRLGPTWVSIALTWLVWASMGIYGHHWASLAVSGQSPKQPTHTHKTQTDTFHKLSTNLASDRHTPITNIPKHSTSYRRLDYIPKGRQLKNKPRRLNKLPTHCASFSARAPGVLPWASLVLPGPLWA